MEIRLVKNNVKAIVNLNGGCLTSVLIDDDQYLWQNESGKWPNLVQKPGAPSQPAPILFPITGPLQTLDQIAKTKDLEKINNRYLINGKFYDGKVTGYFFENQFYEMKQHGFLRNSLFSVLEKSDDACSLSFKSNDETKKIYPFDFEIMLAYQLTPTGVIVNYDVKNTGKKPLPFNIGDHPGFKVEGDIEDYWLKLDSQHDVILGYQTEDGLQEVVCKDGVIGLKREMFADGQAVIIDDIVAKKVTLFKKDEEKLRYNIEADNLLLWSADIDHFICLEPWYGELELFNQMEQNLELGKIKQLAPGENFSYARRLSFYNNDFLNRLKSIRQILSKSEKNYSK